MLLATSPNAIYTQSLGHRLPGQPSYDWPREPPPHVLQRRASPRPSRPTLGPARMQPPWPRTPCATATAPTALSLKTAGTGRVGWDLNESASDTEVRRQNATGIVPYCVSRDYKFAGSQTMMLDGGRLTDRPESSVAGLD